MIHMENEVVQNNHGEREEKERGVERQEERVQKSQGPRTIL